MKLRMPAWSPAGVACLKLGALVLLCVCALAARGGEAIQDALQPDNEPLVVLRAPDPKEIAELVNKLKSADHAVQDEALDALSTIRVDALFGGYLLQLAAKDYGKPEEDAQTVNERLLDLLDSYYDSSFATLIESYFDAYTGKGRTREKALSLLTENGDSEALQIVVRLLKKPASRNLDLSTVLLPFEYAPEKARPLMKDLLALAPELELPNPVYLLALKRLKEKHIRASEHPEFSAFALKRAQQILAEPPFENQAAHYETNGFLEGEPQIPEAFPQKYIEALLLIDVLRFLDTPAADETLKRVLETRAGRLRAYAAASLLSRRQTVAPEVLEQLGAEPATRAALWRALAEVDRLDAFPGKFRSQRDLAEADLAEWVGSPTEMSAPPQQLELLKTVNHKSGDDGELEAYYFFKFRHERYLKGKWLVGMAGPYPAFGDAALDGSATFSRFEELEKKPLEAHIKDYLPE